MNFIQTGEQQLKKQITVFAIFENNVSNESNIVLSVFANAFKIKNIIK